MTSMRIGKTELAGTPKRLLDLISTGRGLTVATLVLIEYPQTKQPEKKRVTFLRYLRQLERMGYARTMQGSWFVTDLGRATGTFLDKDTAVSGPTLRLSP